MRTNPVKLINKGWPAGRCQGWQWQQPHPLITPAVVVMSRRQSSITTPLILKAAPTGSPVKPMVKLLVRLWHLTCQHTHQHLHKADLDLQFLHLDLDLPVTLVHPPGYLEVVQRYCHSPWSKAWCYMLSAVQAYGQLAASQALLVCGVLQYHCCSICTVLSAALSVLQVCNRIQTHACCTSHCKPCKQPHYVLPCLAYSRVLVLCNTVCLTMRVCCAQLLQHPHAYLEYSSLTTPRLPAT